MSSSHINDPPSDDVVSISGSLLEDVHIDFGLEQEEEDSVFDHNLMQYLDQLPIAAPPADAKYSASFVDSVLNDMEAFKQETRHMNWNDTEAPLISSLLEYSQFESEEAYSLAQDQAFSAAAAAAVEQPRAYNGQQEQLYQEQEEIPIQFNMQQDGHYYSLAQPALSIDHSTEYSDCLDLFNLGQDQPNEEEDKGLETTFLAQRKAELDALFNQNEDAAKDFSSWLYYPDDDASQIHLKDDTTHPMVSATADDTFSDEYPMESQHEAKDSFEQTHLTLKVPPPQAQPADDNTTNDAFNDVSHQRVDDFLQRMKAIVAENLARVGADPLTMYNNTNDKPSSSSAMPTSQAKTSLRKSTGKKARHSSSVNISKADFMLVSSSSSSAMSEKNGSDSSFVKRITGTSTPVKKNRKRQLASQENVSTTKQQLASQKNVSTTKQQQPLGNSKRRSTTVLEEVNKNATDTVSTSSHRYSMRTRTSASGIRKTSTTLNKKPVKSRTFNFGSSKKR